MQMIVVLYGLGNNDKKKFVHVQYRCNLFLQILLMWCWLNAQIRNPWRQKTNCKVFIWVPWISIVNFIPLKKGEGDPWIYRPPVLKTDGFWNFYACHRTWCSLAERCVRSPAMRKWNISLVSEKSHIWYQRWCQEKRPLNMVTRRFKIPNAVCIWILLATPTQTDVYPTWKKKWSYPIRKQNRLQTCVHRMFTWGRRWWYTVAPWLWPRISTSWATTGF